MKITYLMTQDIDSPAGVGRVFPLAREMAARGHHPTILALHPDFDSLQERQFERQGVTVQYVSQMHVRKRGSRKTYFSPAQLTGIVLAATNRLTRAALHTPADILHIIKPHPMNSIAGLIARRRSKGALVVDCDDLEVANNRFAGAWQKKVLGYFERHVPRQADAVTTHNSILRQYLQDAGVPDERIYDLPNGVDTERFDRITAREVQAIRQRFGLVDRKVVGYIGSLSTTSHPIEILLQAFARLQLDCPESRLLIVGGGEDYLNLQGKTHQMGLDASVVFTGRIPPDQIPPFYAACDVVVDPVEDDLVGKTRLPIKLFESWAAGIPFITADVGDRRRVMGDPPAGMLVPPGDPLALSQAISKVLHEPELREGLIQRSAQRADDYTWQKIAARMETVYAALLKN